MDTYPFESPRVLVDRAKRHLNTLKSQLEEYRLGHDAVSEIRDHRAGVIVRPGKPVPPRLREIAVDLLANLRSALDQAVYASTTVLVGPDLPGTKFPFGDTAKAAADDANRGCSDVPQDMVDFLLDFGPHPRGNRVLWALDKLRNTKSRRILVAMIADTSTAAIGESKPSVLVGRENGDPYGGILDVSLRRSDGTPNAAALSPDTEIQIGTGPMLGEPAVALFEGMTRLVERVLAGIETETARILRAQGV